MAIDFQIDEASAPSSSAIDFRPDEEASTAIDFQPEASGGLTKEQVGQKIAWEALSPAEQQKRMGVLNETEAGSGDSNLPISGDPNLPIPEHEARIFPFHGYKNAYESGFSEGKQLFGDKTEAARVASDVSGDIMGGASAVFTGANPIMQGGLRMAQAARLGGELAAGDTSNVIDVLEQRQEIMPWLKTDGTISMKGAKKFFGEDVDESVVVQMAADLEKMFREDPANMVMILEGVGKLGMKGYAIREARLGRPIPEGIAKYVPELKEEYEQADLNRVNKILKDRLGKARSGAEEGPPLPNIIPQKTVKPQTKPTLPDIIPAEPSKPVSEPVVETGTAKPGAEPAVPSDPATQATGATSAPAGAHVRDASKTAQMSPEEHAAKLAPLHARFTRLFNERSTRSRKNYWCI